jgi:hypothetical protein
MKLNIIPPSIISKRTTDSEYVLENSNAAQTMENIELTIISITPTKRIINETPFRLVNALIL